MTCVVVGITGIIVMYNETVQTESGSRESSEQYCIYPNTT